MKKNSSGVEADYLFNILNVENRAKSLNIVNLKIRIGIIFTVQRGQF